MADVATAAGKTNAKIEIFLRRRQAQPIQDTWKKVIADFGKGRHRCQQTPASQPCQGLRHGDRPGTIRAIWTSSCSPPSALTCLAFARHARERKWDASSGVLSIGARRRAPIDADRRQPRRRLA